MAYNSKNKWRPYVTYTVLAICVGVYLYAILRYGTTRYSEVLVRIGAKSAFHIVIGKQWWRLITAGFVHIGFEHLLMNGITIYFIGRDLERLVGHTRFLIIYLVSIVGGNLVSLAFRPNSISAGASTGIFGLFAAYVILMKIYPDSNYLRARGNQYVLLIILNLVNGFISPSVDNLGHLGGLIYGLLITYVVGYNRYDRRSNKRRNQLIALIIIVMVSYLLFKHSTGNISVFKELLLR